jgi:hypothetical protein
MPFVWSYVEESVTSLSPSYVPNSVSGAIASVYAELVLIPIQDDM